MFNVLLVSLNLAGRGWFRCEREYFSCLLFQTILLDVNAHKNNVDQVNWNLCDQWLECVCHLMQKFVENENEFGSYNTINIPKKTYLLAKNDEKRRRRQQQWKRQRQRRHLTNRLKEYNSSTISATDCKRKERKMKTKHTVIWTIAAIRTHITNSCGVLWVVVF